MDETFGYGYWLKIVNLQQMCCHAYAFLVLNPIVWRRLFLIESGRRENSKCHFKYTSKEWTHGWNNVFSLI